MEMTSWSITKPNKPNTNRAIGTLPAEMCLMVRSTNCEEHQQLQAMWRKQTLQVQVLRHSAYRSYAAQKHYNYAAKHGEKRQTFAPVLVNQASARTTVTYAFPLCTG